ncbi:MAG: hypothetical protein J6S09_00940 [Paludibacteraceae bacterium]|nr:hypothetical protein [Paludibacteraceae bacterium]
MKRMKQIYLLLIPLIWFCTSCTQWQRAEAVIAMADSLDVTQHVIYNDTVALRQTIRALNNPLGRTFKRNTLAKAYYYMGRNLEDDYNQVERAAECYIEADWLKIENPIYQGRVNSCMAGICADYNQDSLSLLFYERALDNFERSENEWYYANGLLNICMIKCAAKQFAEADSLWKMAASYSFNDSYRWYLNDIRVIYFYYQETEYTPDSIIYYIQQTPITTSYRAIKIANAFYDLGQMDSAAYYAEKVVNDFDVPANKVSAYYILHKYAILNNDILAADSLASLRMDVKRKAETEKIDSLNAIQVFQDYLYYCKTFIWRVIGYSALVITLVLVVLGILWYWRKKKKHIDAQVEALQSAEEEYQQTIEEQRQQRHDALMSHIELVRTRHPKPDKKWNDYSVFRNELNQSLLCLLDKLAEKKLSEKEIHLCVYCLLYYDISTKVLAEYMIYSAVGIRTFKQRTAQKLGTTAANLYDFLVEMAISD